MAQSGHTLSDARLVSEADDTKAMKSLKGTGNSLHAPAGSDFRHAFHPRELAVDLVLAPRVQTEDGLGTPQLHQRSNSHQQDVFELGAVLSDDVTQQVEGVAHDERGLVGVRGDVHDVEAVALQPVVAGGSVVAEEGAHDLGRGEHGARAALVRVVEELLEVLHELQQQSDAQEASLPVVCHFTRRRLLLLLVVSLVLFTTRAVIA